MNMIPCSRLAAANPAQPVSYVRFLNANPDAPSADFYVCGELVAGGVAYGKIDGYYTVAPCTYRFSVDHPHKKNKGAKPECCFDVCPRKAYTIAYTEDGCLLAIEDIADPCRRLRDKCRAYVRFVNLSPNAPPLDVAVTGGLRLFRAVPYTRHTRYVTIEPGTYTFRLSPAGTRGLGIDTAPADFESGRAYSVYAIGRAGGTPPLETLVTPDGQP